MTKDTREMDRSAMAGLCVAIIVLFVFIFLTVLCVLHLKEILY